MRRRFMLLACCLVFGALAQAGPLAVEKVPAPLRPWVGWVMHGKEMLACPPAFNDGQQRSCLWPTDMDLALSDSGARFRMALTAYAADTLVELPGDGEAWPQDLRLDGKPVVVASVDGRPVLRAGPGAHSVTGTLAWAVLPQSVSLPRALGTLRASLRGKPLSGAADAAGRLWLQRPEVATGGDALALQVYRLIDDGVPMRATVRYQLAVSGAARQLVLPAALLPGFIPLAIDSPLPARVDAQGALTVQARAGNWTLSLSARHMQAAALLELPDSAAHEEIWSFQPHNELRQLSLSGAAAVDPKALGVPEQWRGFPAFLLRPGGKLALAQTRRGDPGTEPDRLDLDRRLWLDFDGGGYSVEDRLEGSIARSWRLQIAPPFVLGRAAVDGQDQAITRLAEGAPAGIELRHGRARVLAESRVESAAAALPASGWQADVSGFRARLMLPPGWRLLHVGGADRVGGSWLANWSLWDLFFALLIAVGAARLFGVATGLALAAAFALAWHTPGTPGLPWLALLAFHAVAQALPAGRLQGLARLGRGAAAVFILATLLPFAVQQLRQAIYPALERPDQQLGGVAAPASQAPQAKAPRESEADAGVASSESYQVRAQSKRALPSVAGSEALVKQAELSAIDPNTQVQTGPGLPSWNWHAHDINLQGPLAPGQMLHIYLLPPWAGVLWSLASVLLLALALWRCAAPGLGAASAWRRWLPPLALLPIAAGLAYPGASEAASPAASAPATAESGLFPSPALLDELGSRLGAPPECLPRCAEIARMGVFADSESLALRLEIHAALDTGVPLPGHASQWRPSSVLVDGKPAVLRRDEQGTLWVQLAAGVHQLTLAGQTGDRETLRIPLPLAPRRLDSELAGWTLSGTDARGLATGMIELTRSRPQGAQLEESTGRDSLPPFVRVQRRLTLGQRWSVSTRIEREGPSLAPLTVRVPLLQGEGVTDPSVKVEGGVALLSLGAQPSASFGSSLDEGAALRLIAASEAAQIETWILDASPQWHVTTQGLAPVHERGGQRWLPTWMPWSGETLTLDIAKPAAVDGRMLTFDAVVLRAAPGRRSAEISAVLALRTSRGGNHLMTLPEGAQLIGVTLDGVAQPALAEGRELSIALLPGAHQLRIDWRDEAGMAWRYALPRLDLGAPAVNLSSELSVPGERVVLAVGGPRMGPAVLLWGVLAVTLAAAWALARSRLAPLGFLAWALLGVGLAQASLEGALLVVGWFLALAARARFAHRLSGLRFNAVQIVLLLWTLAAAMALFDTLRGGLLGFPDLLIAGNGSSAFLLRWFEDRGDGLTPAALAYSIPVFAYRLLMLAWALWLAASLVRWLRWAWACYTRNGYWQAWATNGWRRKQGAAAPHGTGKGSGPTGPARPGEAG